MSNIRVGQGYDVHPLVAGRPLILGGVTVPFDRGLQGHSDADVLLHAITDALLGAAALGDIGTWFPDHDPAHQNADSRKLLIGAYAAVQDAGWAVVNIDSTIIAQQPKLRPYLDQMRSNIATDLGLLPAAVSIKAKTNEGLGYLGRQEAMAAQAVVLLTSV
ncbi:2-C-methyl-D-erythritol 2,4-cyclodiphosphate synthase [Neisseriaceae bacterium ESL0693]|nr:2-C-methyl-D-erythritol 2,4-cyclodiphosphate synthase [Neisseriaceae bacterium ESL0693]